VRDLKKLGLWDEVMVNDLKYFDGSLRQDRPRPEDLQGALRHRLRSRAEVAGRGGARRQKWIDQAQSLNIYMAGASGKKLDETYKLAWLRGLKTTYYLRTLSATHAEKSTVARRRSTRSTRALRPRDAMSARNASARDRHQVLRDRQPRCDGVPVTCPARVACSIDNPECEACQ
jgi:ribonucleoside-diphosphate reductase alpha chain